MSKQTMQKWVIFFMVVIVSGLFILNHWVMKEIEQTQAVQKPVIVQEQKTKVPDNQGVSPQILQKTQGKDQVVNDQEVKKQEEETKQEEKKKIIYELPLEDTILLQ